MLYKEGLKESSMTKELMHITIHTLYLYVCLGSDVIEVEHWFHSASGGLQGDNDLNKLHHRREQN